MLRRTKLNLVPLRSTFKNKKVLMSTKAKTTLDILYAYVAPGVVKYLKKEAIERDISLSDLVMEILRKHYAGNKNKLPDFN